MKLSAILFLATCLSLFLSPDCWSLPVEPATPKVPPAGAPAVQPQTAQQQPGASKTGPARTPGGDAEAPKATPAPNPDKMILLNYKNSTYGDHGLLSIYLPDSERPLSQGGIKYIINKEKELRKVREIWALLYVVKNKDSILTGCAYSLADGELVAAYPLEGDVDAACKKDYEKFRRGLSHKRPWGSAKPAQ